MRNDSIKILQLLNESIEDLDSKYVFPQFNEFELYDAWNFIPEDLYSPNEIENIPYWGDQFKATKIKPELQKIKLDNIYQVYEGDDENYDFSVFNNIEQENVSDLPPIDTIKLNNKYIIMDGNHRAAYCKVKDFDYLYSNVYDLDKYKEGYYEKR